MALYPNNFNGKDTLQPGARGERFQSQFPGHRDEEANRVNRTNMKLNTSQHDVPNIKYQFDYRLPVLFKYGYAFGFNQMVVPKGRIVAVDPYMDLVDFDMRKQHNTMTIANGGAPVRLREAGDTYRDDSGADTALTSVEKQGQAVENIGTEWIPLVGMDTACMKTCFYPLATAASAQLTAADFSIHSETGRVVDLNGDFVDHVRPANIPIGMMQRNEYTRDDDALNGMMPGPVLTDALVELPWFAYKDKAEMNPWGSAYGALTPGMLVKSDENGRVVPSPLSMMEFETLSMDIQIYEAERQQVIGQVYAVNNNMLPEGAARWATWALEDRMNFDEFNPAVWKQNARRGEDAVANSPYGSTGEYPGYPYDKAYKDSDLHMLASTGRLDNFDQRMNFEHQYENLGIPGLTDGKNAVVRQYDAHKAGVINKRDGDVDYVDMFFRTIEVEVEDLHIKIGNNDFVPCVAGLALKAISTGDDCLKVKYADQKQGIVVLEVTDATKLDDSFTDGAPIAVEFKFNKRGLAGVPTFMDWDGCVGSVKILLTK